MSRFVVISTQRTGSTMLIMLLNSHPDILCAGEIFYPRSGSDYTIQKYASESTGKQFRHRFMRASLVNEFLDNFYSQNNFAAIGFKFMYSQARYIPWLYPSALSYMQNRKLAIIHNVRNNHLRVLVSRISSKSSGIYRSNVALNREPIFVPIKNLRRNLANLRQDDNKWTIKFSGQPYLQVNYESLLANPACEQKRILDFIGVKYTGELTSPFTRLATTSIASLIQNYSEVKRELEGTKFESFLSDNN